MASYTPPLRQQLADLKSKSQTTLTHGRTTQRHADILIDLERRLRLWLSGMTPLEQRRRFSTQEIVALAHLQGKRSPAPGDRLIGQTLRSMGFTPRRDWTVAGRNKRYWQLK